MASSLGVKLLALVVTLQIVNTVMLAGVSYIFWVGGWW